VRDGRRAVDGRFIPTCMGNSSPVVTMTRWVPVHPHVHGELGVPIGNYLSQYGSSPRAWGTLEQFADRDDRARFIPTCMGNSHGAD